MIQRIQTVYMALVAIFTGIAFFLFPLWDDAGRGIMAEEVKFFPILFALIVGLVLFSILQYKNRKLQFVLNRVNLLINLAAIILVLLPAYANTNPVGLENIPVQIANGGVLPLINIVLLVFANRGIKRDENLIKSVDRLR